MTDGVTPSPKTMSSSARSARDGTVIPTDATAVANAAPARERYTRAAIASAITTPITTHWITNEAC